MNRVLFSVCCAIALTSGMGSVMAQDSATDPIGAMQAQRLTPYAQAPVSGVYPIDTQAAYAAPAAPVVAPAQGVPTVYAAGNKSVSPIVDNAQVAPVAADMAPVYAPAPVLGTSVSLPPEGMTESLRPACPSNGDYDPATFNSSMAQKMALLEAEKEDLRRRLGAAQPGDYRPISQCVAQDNRIAELEAQVDFLKEQNASLKKAQDEAMRAAAEAAAQAAGAEASGGSLSTPELPPLGRPDLPEMPAPTEAQ